MLQGHNKPGAYSPSIKHLRAKLRGGLRRLRRQYRTNLRHRAGPNEIYCEWLRDNYYLVEREGGAVLRELRQGGDAHALQAALALCRASLCPQGSLAEPALFAQALARAKVTSAVSEALPLALRFALVNEAVASAAEKDKEQRVRQLRGAVTALRALPELDLPGILEETDPLEACLRRDPAGVYPRMEEGSRAALRHLLRRAARRAHQSDEGYAGAQMEICAGVPEGSAARHIGTGLMQQALHPGRGAALLWGETLLPVVFSVLAATLCHALILLPLLVLPLHALCRIALEALLLRGVDTVPLPRMELGGMVPEEGATLLTVATLLPGAAKAGELAKRLESLHRANGGPHVCVCALTDLKGAATKTLPGDAADIAAARKEVARLNLQYGGGFLLAVRPRVFSPTMGSYTGRERKRGAIADLAAALAGKAKEEVIALCGDTANLQSYRYLCVLDADTRLPLDSLPDMVAAALHPSNRPVFDPALGRVVHGYGILAPHVELDLESARKTPFAHAMAGEGGSTPYANRVSERYQDLFGRGIFTGKGLIDLEAFRKVLAARPFPAEQVLSHDILEGGLLRAGFLADVSVTDGFPANAQSYFIRQERWVRGDWQNLPFLQKSKGLPALARYQLFDNLRRSLLAPACLLAALAAPFVPAPAGGVLAAAGVLGICGGNLCSALRCLCAGGVAMLSRDFYSGGFPAALGDFIRGGLQVITLPQHAWINLCAAARGLWRTFVTKKNRLAWTTAAQGDAAGHTLKSLLRLWPCAAAAVPPLVWGGAGLRLLGLLFLGNLLFSTLSAKPGHKNHARLHESQRGTIEGYCAAMWNYFETYCTEEHHFLPPDNVQETPVFRVAARSSPTNLGLYLLCVLAARDLRLIDSDGLALRLGRTLASIDQLETWNGHLLNWYDTRTLRPLEPRYVSTVDSGNFLVAIRTLRRGLEEYAPECPALAPLLPRLQALEKGCDLRALYHPRRKLFHIGFDLQTQKPSQSYYDLLMSEARMTSCYAIATGAVPKKHWGALGRTLARQGRFAGPVSWTGTMFEYFMPYLFLPAPKGTLGYEALRFCLNCQRGRAAKAARGRQLPWGISESGFYAFDAELNYQYKAHGVQKLGLRRGLDDELVLAPYASFLAMPLAPRSALANLKRFARMELQGSCGFYEAADATPARACGQDYAAVRSYMAHHVGMSLLAALNTLQNGVLQKRFFSDSEMARVQDLLQERIPDRGVVYRDVELRDAPRPRERVSSAKECFAAADPANPKTHLLTNGEWGCVLTDCGAGAAFYRGVSMLRHNPDLLRHPGGVLPLLREQGRPPVSITPAPHGNARKTKIEFSAAEAVFAGEGTQVAASMRVRVHPRLPAEERRFTLKNTSKQTAAGALWVYFEPWLAPPQTTHPAFSKLFLRDSYDESTGIATFLRRRAETGESLCLAAGMTTEATCERLRERALPRGLLFGAAPVTAPQTARPAAGDCCGAFTVEYTLQAGESRAFSLWLCAGISRMEASQRLAHLREESNGKRRGTETGGKSPFRDGEMAAALAKQVLPRLLYYTPLAPAQTAARKNAVARRKALWPLGISGEEPYLYLSLAGEEEVPSVLPWLRLCRVLRAAGVPCALAIGYREGGDYNTPMTAALRQALVRERCAHLLQGGIYLLNLNGADAKATEALPVYAAHICGGEGGWHPRECPVAPPLCLQATNAGPVCEPETEKALHTGCGTFLPGRFVIEKREGAPTVPWSHVLANPAFGTLVSDSALGCTWAVNARENKLTPWENDPCGDNRGELLLLKFGNQVFDLCLGARCELTPAAVRWQGEIHGLAYEITAWVPAKGLCKQVEITLRNQTARTLTPELTYYTEPVLGVGREPQLPLLGEALPDGLLLHAPDAGVRGCAALLMTGGADIRCVDRGAFWHGNWHAGGTLPQGDPCAAVGWRLQIPPMAEAVATFALTWGANRNAALCAHLVAVKEAPPANTPLRVRLPNPALCAMVNTWLPHQILTARLYGRTGHYQCGGAYGMRDQLQDVSAFFMTQPALARRQIARCAAAQFPEGDAMHWWHRLPGHVTRGVRTRYADDYLWLPYITADYCLATGDTAFLRVKIPFRQGAPLGPEAHERYAGYPLGGERATLWAHCTRALDRALGLLGPHGLPLILGGDWNDSMNRVGVAGRGESVWLAMFLSAALRRFLRLCVPMGAPALEEKYRHAAARLDERVEAHAWAGDRYLRAFWDDGTPLGGKDGAPCAIDLLPQAFSILRTGDAAEEPPNAARIRQALDSAAERLLDREHGILRLLREPFLAARQGRRAGYINDYPPGVRENGGQYTHAAVWFAMALLRAGRTDEAYALLRMLNPADFCQDAGRMARYCGEPYALAGDVLGAPGREGRAGWTLYTGSAAWFWRCVVEELLGVRMENGQIKAAGPQYPAGWHKDDIAVWLGDTQVV